MSTRIEVPGSWVFESGRVKWVLPTGDELDFTPIADMETLKRTYVAIANIGVAMAMESLKGGEEPPSTFQGHVDKAEQLMREAERKMEEINRRASETLESQTKKLGSI